MESNPEISGDYDSGVKPTPGPTSDAVTRFKLFAAQQRSRVSSRKAAAYRENDFIDSKKRADFFKLKSNFRDLEILAQDPKKQKELRERAFEDIVTNLKKSNTREESLNLMQWVSFAQKPLSLDQLRDAFGSQNLGFTYQGTRYLLPHVRLSDSQSGYRTDLQFGKDDAWLKERIATWSGGLVKVQDDDKSLVQFIQDSSTTRFFRESGLRLLNSTSTDDPIKLGHDNLAITCINYLKCSRQRWTSSDDAARAKWMIRMPFFAYALRYWPIHLKLAGQSGNAQAFAFEQFAWSQAHEFHTWTALFNQFFPHEASFFAMPGSTLLHLAAALGLRNLAKNLLYTPVDLETTDDEGNRPIHYAARHGWDEIVKQLVSAGAHVEHRNWKGKTPLIIAIESQHLVIVEVLVDHGADVNAQGEGHMTALQAATNTGHEAIMRCLRNRLESQTLRRRVYNLEDAASIDDSSSVASGDSVFSTAISASSLSTLPGVVNDIFEEFLQTLISDTELRYLYIEAHAKFDTVRFERNHERLLRSYFKSLRDNAADSKQNIQVVRTLGPKRIRIQTSRRVYENFEIPNYVKTREMDRLRRQSVERKINLDRFLTDKFPETEPNHREPNRGRSVDESGDDNGKENVEVSRQKIEEESVCGNEDESVWESIWESEDESDDENESETIRLNQVKDFLLRGHPFKEFKKGLRRFIHPPATIEEAAEDGDVKYFERFLENVTGFQYIRLNRIREIGYPSSELAEFLIKDVNSNLKDLEHVGILLKDGPKQPTEKLPIQDFIDTILQSELKASQYEPQVIDFDNTVVPEPSHVAEEIIDEVPLLQPEIRNNTTGESITKLEKGEGFLVTWNCCCRRKFSAHVPGTSRKLAEEALRQVEWNESRDGQRILHPSRRSWVHNLAWNIPIADFLINFLLNKRSRSQRKPIDLEHGRNRGSAEFSNVEQSQAEVTTDSLFQQTAESHGSQGGNPNTMFVCLFNRNGRKWRLSHAKFPRNVHISERQRSKAPDNYISRDNHAELEMHDKDQKLFNALRSKLLKKRRPWYRRLIYPTRWKGVRFWEFHLYHTQKLVHPEVQNKLPYESQDIISEPTKDASSISASEMTPLLSRNKQPEQPAPLASISSATAGVQTDLLNNICTSEEWTYERLEKDRLVKYKVNLKSDYLLHLLQCPWEAHPNSPIWQGLPRKINRKLTTKADPKLGWGFQIEEEWDAMTFTIIICPFIIIVFIIATVLGVTYNWPVATAVAISMGSVTVTSLLYTMLTNISKQDD